MATTYQPDNLRERRRLYDQGCTDIEIARRMGAKRNTITVWRRARCLPLNRGPNTYTRLSPEQRAARMLLYQLGWGDRHIAREQGLNRSSVRLWRHSLGLASNFPSGCTERWRPRPTMKDVLRRIQGALGRSLPADIIDDAAADMMLAILDGTIPLDEIELQARRFGNKVLERFANRYGPRSLDEAIPGTDDLLGIDMVVDERSSSWLEEMGATWY